MRVAENFKYISEIFQSFDSHKSKIHLQNFSAYIFFAFFACTHWYRLCGLLTSIMVDRKDRYRHGRIAQHASIQREKIQQLHAPFTSSTVDA